MSALVINLYGGPGLGKSTMAANIFSELKWKNINCELVAEYAKDKVWEESLKVLENQIYVFGKQHHRLFRLKDQVDIIVTDSPILLSVIYDAEKRDVFKQLVTEEYNKFNNLNILLKREKEYSPIGRLQTEEEAIEKDKEVKVFLDSIEGFKYETISGSKEGVDMIVSMAIEKISKEENEMNKSYENCENVVFHRNVEEGIEDSHCQCIYCMARNKWNKEADEYNQWHELGKDEKDKLIYKFSKYKIKDKEKIKNQDEEIKKEMKTLFFQEELRNLQEKIKCLEKKNKKMHDWIDDLQSGMYVNCVYCGHRYGPKDSTPCSMSEILQRHVEVCTEHPMHKFRVRVKELLQKIDLYSHSKEIEEEIQKMLEELK